MAKTYGAKLVIPKAFNYNSSSLIFQTALLWVVVLFIILGIIFVFITSYTDKSELDLVKLKTFEEDLKGNGISKEHILALAEPIKKIDARYERVYFIFKELRNNLIKVRNELANLKTKEKTREKLEKELLLVPKKDKQKQESINLRIDSLQADTNRAKKNVEFFKTKTIKYIHELALLKSSFEDDYLLIQRIVNKLDDSGPLLSKIPRGVDSYNLKLRYIRDLVFLVPSLKLSPLLVQSDRYLEELDVIDSDIKGEVYLNEGYR
jgi:hypothetical protein